GAAVDPDDIAGALVSEVDERRTIEWDRDRGQVVERVERRLGSMRLDESVRKAAPSDDAAAVVLRHVRATRMETLGWTADALSLRERVAFLHRNRGEPWPDWSQKALLATLDTWLAPYLAGITSSDELHAVDLVMVLRSQL